MKQMTGKAPIPEDLVVREFPTPAHALERSNDPENADAKRRR